MKPRLAPYPFTEEDSAAIMFATRRTWHPARALLEYMRADRRDADLMRALGEARQAFRRVGIDHGLLVMSVNDLPLSPLTQQYAMELLRRSRAEIERLERPLLRAAITLSGLINLQAKYDVAVETLCRMNKAAE